MARSAQALIDIANLLPWSIRNGEWLVLVEGPVAREPTAQCRACAQLAQSPSQFTLFKELRSAAEDPGQKASVKGLLDMIPFAFQQLIFEAVRDRFLRRFAQGRVSIGERSWNLGGDPLKVYRVYTAVRETLAAIAVPQLRVGKSPCRHAHTAVAHPPGGVVWDQRQPAIRFVLDIVLDGLREALAGLDSGRIKRCPECDALFLAQRMDKSACSLRCLNLARVHRHRARRSQYEYNRELKSAGITKPGTA